MIRWELTKIPISGSARVLAMIFLVVDSNDKCNLLTNGQESSMCGG